MVFSCYVPFTFHTRKLHAHLISFNSTYVHPAEFHYTLARQAATHIQLLRHQYFILFLKDYYKNLLQLSICVCVTLNFDAIVLVSVNVTIAYVTGLNEVDQVNQICSYLDYVSIIVSLFQNFHPILLVSRCKLVFAFFVFQKSNIFCDELFNVTMKLLHHQLFRKN